MRLFTSLRGLGMLTMAAAIAPFVFFALLFLMVFGLAAVTMGPLIFAFVSWMMLNKWSRRAALEAREAAVIEARVVREEGPVYPPESYTPPVHFDLLLSAKQDIGRILGATTAIDDAAVAKQFRALAERADLILTRVIKEPARLGLARRFFSSYLPRAADLANGYHHLTQQDSGAKARREKLIDVLYRLEHAMQQEEDNLSSPDLSRIDADMKILADDLKPVAMPPSFTRAPEPILNRVDEIVREARKKS